MDKPAPDATFDDRPGLPASTDEAVEWAWAAYRRSQLPPAVVVDLHAYRAKTSKKGASGGA